MISHDIVILNNGGEKQIHPHYLFQQRLHFPDMYGLAAQQSLINRFCSFDSTWTAFTSSYLKDQKCCASQTVHPLDLGPPRCLPLSTCSAEQKVLAWVRALTWIPQPARKSLDPDPPSLFLFSYPPVLSTLPYLLGPVGKLAWRETYGWCRGKRFRSQGWVSYVHPGRKQPVEE